MMDELRAFIEQHVRGAKDDEPAVEAGPFRIAITNNPDPARLKKLLAAHRDGEHGLSIDLLDGNTYHFTEIGAWLNNQQYAVELMALMHHLGMAKLDNVASDDVWLKPAEITTELPGGKPRGERHERSTQRIRHSERSLRAISPHEVPKLSGEKLDAYIEALEQVTIKHREDVQKSILFPDLPLAGWQKSVFKDIERRKQVYDGVAEELKPQRESGVTKEALQKIIDRHLQKVFPDVKSMMADTMIIGGNMPEDTHNVQVAEANLMQLFAQQFPAPKRGR